MTRQPRVLVIDDEQSVRDAFCDALEDAPYEVQTAACGADALVLASEQQHDLIFLDLKMPGIDGVDTLRALHDLNCRGQVYIVTAFHPEFLDRLEAAEREGLAFELVCKPIGQEAIREIARTALETPKQRRRCSAA